jgi:hypothetical protein
MSHAVVILSSQLSEVCWGVRKCEEHQVEIKLAIHYFSTCLIYIVEPEFLSLLMHWWVQCASVTGWDGQCRQSTLPCFDNRGD